MDRALEKRASLREESGKYVSCKLEGREDGYPPLNRSKLIGELLVDANEAIFILKAILFPAIVMVTQTKRKRRIVNFLNKGDGMKLESFNHFF